VNVVGPVVITMTKKREEKFSLVRNIIKPSTSNESSDRDNESKIYTTKKRKNESIASVDCDRSTPETVLLDDSKSTVVSSVEYDEPKQSYSVLDRFEVHLQGNKGIPSDLKVVTGGFNSENKGISPRSDASRIAGQRLYSQALERSQRIAYLRQLSRTSTLGMELDTQSFETPVNWGASPSKRFLALYEYGKNRLTSERQLHKEKSLKRASSALNEVTARYANARTVNIYERGRQRLIDRKLQQNVVENYAGESHVKNPARFASLRLRRLYELGKNRVEKRRIRSDPMKRTQKYAQYAPYATPRLSELHHLGKRKITESRDVERKKKVKMGHNFSDGELASLRPNRRQIILSEIGRQNIINQRLIAERQKEKHELFSCRLPPRFGEE